ncbi:MAG: hypothetical protein NT157_04955 [Candidatus Micrarchaeota archaeon]|nr:hypothetical protein [Candidatus Micrarchaeota archaeon]
MKLEGITPIIIFLLLFQPFLILAIDFVLLPRVNLNWGHLEYYNAYAPIKMLELVLSFGFLCFGAWAYKNKRVGIVLASLFFIITLASMALIVSDLAWRPAVTEEEIQNFKIGYYGKHEVWDRDYYAVCYKLTYGYVETSCNLDIGHDSVKAVLPVIWLILWILAGCTFLASFFLGEKKTLRQVALVMFAAGLLFLIFAASWQFFTQTFMSLNCGDQCMPGGPM